jgi:glycosyltransferase involved in cell wall biosynthesis
MMRICNALAAAGYEVELIGRKRKNSIPLESRPYKQTRINCRFETGKLFYIEYSIRLFAYLLLRKVDVLSAVDLDTLLPNTIVAKIRSKKLVFDAHEYFTEVPEVYTRKMTKLIWSVVANMCIPKVNVAYTVSHSLANIFTNKYHKQFGVIRNVPPLEKQYQHRTERIFPPVLFYQGDLNEGRGLEQIIKAMTMIDATLLIAGEGPLMNDLKQLVTSKQLTHKVTFLGYVKPKDLPDVIGKATVGLNILEHRGQSYYYSLSNKFFAYMHAGLPQICAAFPEYERINVSYEVAVLTECSTDAVAVAVNNLLQDSGRYSKLQQNCLAAREYYNWDKESQQLLQLYQHVTA